MDWIRRNFGLRVTAVVVAIGLWFTFNYLTSSAADTKSLELPLSVHGVSSGLVAQSTVQTVTIELEGSRPVLENLSPSDFSAYVDCSGKPAGTMSLNVAVVGPDSDKLVRSITPATSVVVLEQYGYRRVPVISDDTVQNTIVTETQPKSVLVAGGETTVARVMAARVSVDASSATKALVLTLKPVAVDVHLEPVDGVTVAPVTVRVAIAPKT
jgi:YbbR domain-containing protein